MKTVNLKGKEYAPVSERIQALHEEIAGQEERNLDIRTKVEFKEGYAYVKAQVSFYRGTFTGHAFGKLTGEKALEKLETVAVGRALAFAGYTAGGEIASYEEIEKFQDNGISI